ncbi:hypothetical protein TorRG33x02_157360 [Trema orientale]|uniref:Uncharacterized protein n=1 Tax=Trema orientale TaxID=63057 RepID=A0A2P5ESL5_TREOI|nr:hypothetical protein TorRG33x02_157360 [Trema orientale]
MAHIALEVSVVNFKTPNAFNFLNFSRSSMKETRPEGYTSTYSSVSKSSKYPKPSCIFTPRLSTFLRTPLNDLTSLVSRWTKLSMTGVKKLSAIERP